MAIPARGRDPELNERGILRWLQDEGMPHTPNGVRACLGMILVGCHDRQVKRKFFMEMIDLSTAVQVTMADLECGMRMMQALKDAETEVDTENIKSELEKLANSWKTQRKKLAEMWKLVCECPTSEDTIS